MIAAPAVRKTACESYFKTAGKQEEECAALSSKPFSKSLNRDNKLPLKRNAATNSRAEILFSVGIELA